jgi:hypothetical protein
LRTGIENSFENRFYKKRYSGVIEEVTLLRLATYLNTGTRKYQRREQMRLKMLKVPAK